eukprot:TRINITY_DN575_c1_g1_i3.p1 TRINITY_DN575_c1_g1~~TRINITY_DN575_c1_g1_i3.p1  ORF type:complete len:220 (-),score=-26.44 TRINITY_DN575_c1_g1_i3:36-695(-)
MISCHIYQVTQQIFSTKYKIASLIISFIILYQFISNKNDKFFKKLQLKLQSLDTSTKQNNKYSQKNIGLFHSLFPLLININLSQSKMISLDTSTKQNNKYSQKNIGLFHSLFPLLININLSQSKMINSLKNKIPLINKNVNLQKYKYINTLKSKGISIQSSATIFQRIYGTPLIKKNTNIQKYKYIDTIKSKRSKHLVQCCAYFTITWLKLIQQKFRQF